MSAMGPTEKIIKVLQQEIHIVIGPELETQINRTYLQLLILISQKIKLKITLVSQIGN